MKAERYLIKKVASAVSWLLDLLFPQKCVVCDQLLLYKGELCSDCLNIWKSARLARCPVCNRTARACKCRTFHGIYTDALDDKPILALTFYGKYDSDDIRDIIVHHIIYALKTNSDRSSVRMTSRELSRSILKSILLEGEKPENYRITYPPRSIKRTKEYGFDHAHDLAKHISKYTGIPLQETMKNKGKKAQKALNSMERKFNADNAYVLRKNSVISGKYILVDDVITTGATVNAAAKLLKEAGATAVYPVCIARTKNKKRRVRRPAANPWFKSV